ncbi:TMP-TENI-domain-containing protein [Mycena venus]|uniref:TMP-TENI-domain-containing protein n=1 Tax=Mycena venus TaxID=2733690 RepID=A0A8H6YQ69_9AGAR|nr:TMP-TENI-domain-containing protein [Mycena venus]
MSTEAVQPTLRIVPGAPPAKGAVQICAEKAQGKAEPGTPDVLESSSAALIEKAPEPSDIQAGAVASDLVVQPEPETTPAPEEEIVLKPSPIVDLIHKRLKATSKKISRISTYASTAPEKLNDDQKATLKTLPALEAVQKELGEVKKAVEAYEAQLVNELTQKRHEAEKAEKARIASAVSAAETAALSKASELLNVLRLRSLLASGELSSALDDAEVSAVFSAGEALLAEVGETKQGVLTGFMLGQGTYQDISYARLLEITQLALNPPRAPTPVQEAPVETGESSAEGGPDLSSSNQPQGLAMSSSFAFLTASELEPSFEDNVEWVERSDATGHQEEQVVEPVNGHVEPDEPIATATPPDESFQSNAALDWAADDEEGGLPPIAGLHAKFGTSGSATPVVVEELQTNGHPAANVEPAVSASAPAPAPALAPAPAPAPAPAQEEDDGFTQARGRGRARGFRGNERGTDRGGFRGGSRGGDRGFRGGDRGRGEAGARANTGVMESVDAVAEVVAAGDSTGEEVPNDHPRQKDRTRSLSDAWLTLARYFSCPLILSAVLFQYFDQRLFVYHHHMDPIDFSLYLVTDRSLLPVGKTLAQVVEQALVGGVTVVQIREKTADTAEFLQIARESKELCDRYKVPLIINDRIDIALAVGARGVHLGQTDMPIDIARKLMPQGTIIGISCNTVDEVRAAREAKADYVGLGAVWDTQTKKLTSSPIGVRGLGTMLEALDGSNVRAVAIGGIKSSNLAHLLHGSISRTEHWLDGVAVVSDIVASPDPERAARRLKSILDAGRKAATASAESLKNTSISSRDDILNTALTIMDTVRSLNPLVHQMTNTVVANQSANITLALGASPMMATAPEEMADLSKLSHALLVNIGTLVADSLQGMLKAGRFVNTARNPVVLDPVGIGASDFRKNSVNELLNSWQATVIKGNAGELAALAGSSEAASKGVDSLGSFKDPVNFTRQLAQKERCVIVLTGETDYISDGWRVLMLKNGDPLLGKITGSGCMVGSCIASYCAAANLLASDDEHQEGRLTRGGDFLSATVGAVLTLTIASELAAKRKEVHGIGSFLPALIDEVAALRPEDIRRLAKLEVVE